MTDKRLHRCGAGLFRAPCRWSPARRRVADAATTAGFAKWERVPTRQVGRYGCDKAECARPVRDRYMNGLRHHSSESACCECDASHGAAVWSTRRRLYGASTHGCSLQREVQPILADAAEETLRIVSRVAALPCNLHSKAKTFPQLRVWRFQQFRIYRPHGLWRKVFVASVVEQGQIDHLEGPSVHHRIHGLRIATDGAEPVLFEEWCRIYRPLGATRGEVDYAVLAANVDPRRNLGQAHLRTVGKLHFARGAVNPYVQDWIGHRVATPSLDEELELLRRGNVSMDIWLMAIAPTERIKYRFYRHARLLDMVAFDLLEPDVFNAEYSPFFCHYSISRCSWE